METVVSTREHGDTGQTAIKLFVYAAVIVVIAELIGSFAFKIGPGKVVLLPMIWALLLGAALGLLSQRSKNGLSLDVPTQFYAAAILQPALLLFIAKLGLMIGSALPKLAAAGWALVFQEFGHFVGTILLAAANVRTDSATSGDC